MDKKIEEKLKEALEKKTVIIGSREVGKALKLGKVNFIVVANNCPETLKKDFEHYSKLSEIDMHVFDGTGKQLGIFCGKPFPITSLAVKGKKK